MIIDPTYIRPLPPQRAIWTIRVQEFLAFLWCGSVALGAALVGQWPFPFVLQAYCMGVFIVTLNALRTLGAHRWTNHDDQEMTFLEQLADTVNYPNPWSMASLWGPIGTRFHALHHLFPTLPYHNMQEAHRRLSALLPADSVYHQTTEHSLTAAIAKLVRRSLAENKEQAAEVKRSAA